MYTTIKQYEQLKISDKVRFSIGAVKDSRKQTVH